MIKVPIFVYGTLRKNGRFNEAFLNGRPYVTIGEAQGLMFDLDEYPGCMFTEIPETMKVYSIIGEVYYINRDELRQLDMLEGYTPRQPDRNTYTRIRIEVQTPSSLITSFAYQYRAHTPERLVSYGIPLINSGDWIEYKRTRRRK